MVMKRSRQRKDYYAILRKSSADANVVYPGMRRSLASPWEQGLAAAAYSTSVFITRDMLTLSAVTYDRADNSLHSMTISQNHPTL